MCIKIAVELRRVVDGFFFPSRNVFPHLFLYSLFVEKKVPIVKAMPRHPDESAV